MEQEKADAILANLTVGTVEMIAEGSNFVVEAVKEDMKIKQDLFKKMESICAEDVVFATNTSSLSITEMASGLTRPLVGMHFFNPAPVMKLIEIIRGNLTDEEVVLKMQAFAQEIGKTPVIVQEAPGFVVNRLLIPMINEAIFVLGEGVAYIVGAVFYSFHKVKYVHAVFHFFVLLGSACHMMGVWGILQSLCK